VTKRYLGYALAVIFFANFLSYLDRQIVSALEDKLTAAFDLSKKEFGGLWTAFTVGYMVFAPVVGFLTDRVRRTRLFAVCVFLWSLATIASGYAPTKTLLYATRFFIGIGEAGCLVIGPTLLSDYFSKEVRGKALSVFFLALPLGGTAGYVVGGLLSSLFGWRQAFLFAGLPGLLVAALIWFLLEPRRGESGAGIHGHGPAPSGPPPAAGAGAYLDLLRNRTLLFIILAQAFAVTFLVPLLHFGVGFFQTKHGMVKNEATTTLGAIALVAGGLGTWLSGFLGDRFAKRSRGAYATLASVAFAAGLPFLIVGFTAQARLFFLPALTMGAFCYFLCMPAVNTQIANAVSPRQRAMAYALAVFILHLLGDTTAPIVFGAVADAKMEQVRARPAEYPMPEKSAGEIHEGLPLLDRFPAREWTPKAEDKALLEGRRPATPEEQAFLEVHKPWDAARRWVEATATQRAFLMFSFALLLASAACFLASRHAARDEARFANSEGKT
jgi:MFS family permease